MKSFCFIVIISAFLCSCSRQDPGEHNLISNPSAEEYEGSVVTGWNSETHSPDAVLFYDNLAHQGKRSLVIYSGKPAEGRWMTRVQLKPWSKYRFSGWVRTENLAAPKGKGAGFRLDPFRIDFQRMTGTNDWTRTMFEFETGNDDSGVLSCMMNSEGPSTGRAWFDDMSIQLISSEKLNPSVKIDLADVKEPISEYIYGQFIEHLGRCIYGGIWAEMIMDRKFWYQPGETESPWIITGNRKLFSLDRNSPFTGDKSPLFSLNGRDTVSLRQSGLGFKPDLDYNGRIILKGTSGIREVKLTLRLADTSEVITIKGLTGEYRSYPFSFHSRELDHDASIDIMPSGSGKVWIGTVSMMPADNIEGFRADVLALLRELDSPVYRWPGGNFVSGYNWKDGIGDRDRRPPRKNPAWLGIESNDVGINEFMEFCRLLNTEPYIAVNAGIGGAEQARQEVEYCNGPVNTGMGKLRKENGHTDPWKVKFWSVGNEMYGDWQLGHMSTGDFVKKHNSFAAAMRSADPGIRLIAVGDLGDWDRMILSNCSGSMDYISEHFYRQDWHGGGLMTHVKQIPDAIREKAEAHRHYRNEIPSLKGKDIRICMDEWNYWYGPHIYGELGTRYFFRDAMGIAAGINEYSRQSDMIFMANYAQAVNVIGAIKTNTTQSVIDATGQVLKLYRHVFGTIPVTITGDWRPLDIAAALNAAKDTLTVSVINPTAERIPLPDEVLNGQVTGKAQKWQVIAPDDMSTNEPGRPESVKISGPVPINDAKTLDIDPVSISIFVFPVNR